MKCTNCGNEELLNNNKFCAECGHPIGDQQIDNTMEDTSTIEESKEIAEKTIELEKNNAEETVNSEIDTEDFSQKSFQELEKYMENEKNKGETPLVLPNEEANNDREESELLNKIEGGEEAEEKIDELTEEFQEKSQENKGKGGLKFKFQLGTFIIGLIAILLAAYYVTSLANKNDTVLLIDSETNIYVSKVGSKKTTLFKENTEEYTIDFMRGDNKGNYYYPKDIKANDIGIAEFDVYKSNGKDEDINLISDVEGAVYPTSDGKYVFNFKSINVMYNNLLGDLYLHDHTSNTLVEKDVFAESLKISKDGKYALFLKDEATDLYIYDFSKKSTTKIDEGINGIVNVDDNFEKIIYTKSNADIGTLAVSSAYTTSYKGVTKKIATNIIDGEAAVFGDKLIYGKPNETIPDFKEYLLNPEDFKEEDTEKSKLLWDNFFNYNFFELWEVNLNGSDEKLVGKYIHAIEYISEDGTIKVLTRIKNSEEIEKFSEISDAELSKLPNLVKEIYLSKGIVQSFPSNTREVLESTGVYGSPYVADVKTNTLYYIYNGNLYSTTLGSEDSSATLIDTNVKVIIFKGDKLTYNKEIITETEESNETEETENNEIVEDEQGTVTTELYQLGKDGKTLLDTEVATELLAALDDVIAYYKLVDEEIVLYRVNDGNVKALGKVSSGIMEIYEDIVYYVDKNNDLYMSKGEKVDLLEEKVTNIMILEK